MVDETGAKINKDLMCRNRKLRSLSPTNYNQPVITQPVYGGGWLTVCDVLVGRPSTSFLLLHRLLV